ncbi:MAG: hypothetical protein J5787_07070 [Alphaproteobacteria bacterium]|nr:hypothetical protein [Alphaproteobacteria bacterium]MBO4644029.1 hypothetical protein [Alphaproteobacteria bacterium]
MSIVGILAAFINPAAHSLSNIFDAYIIGNLFKKTSTAVFYANITNIIGPLALLFIGPIHLLPLSVLPYALLIGLINIGYLFPYYKALKTTDTSIVAALFSLERLFVPFWAYMIVGEIMKPVQYAGLGIIITASLVLNIENPKRVKINSGFWLMLSATVILSFETVLYKRILLQTDWVSAAFWCACLTYVFRWFILCHKSARQDIIKNLPEYKAHLAQFCFIEIFDQLGNLAPVFALASIPVLVETSITSTQPIFVMICGYFLTILFGNRFKENLSPREMIKKIICFILIGIGISLAIGI